MTATLQAPEDTLRAEAIERLKKRSDFWAHFAAYVLVNVLIIAVWFVVSDGGFFWPVFPLLGWGIGVFFHAWDTFSRPLSEERIRREMQRLGDR
jgi:hypothetical protein